MILLNLFINNFIKKSVLPSGDSVNPYRWVFVGIVPFLYLFLDHFFIGISLFLLISIAGPFYEYFVAWWMEDTKAIGIFVDKIQEKALKVRYYSTTKDV
jgi:hypothetical protein